MGYIFLILQLSRTYTNSLVEIFMAHDFADHIHNLSSFLVCNFAKDTSYIPMSL